MAPAPASWIWRAIWMSSASGEAPTASGETSFKPRYGVERSIDRKSTRLNSSHLVISYAVFCLNKERISLASTLPASSRPSAPAIAAGLPPHAHARVTAWQAPTYGPWGWSVPGSFFFFNDTASTEIYTLSLHEALPI